MVSCKEMNSTGADLVLTRAKKAISSSSHQLAEDRGRVGEAGELSKKGYQRKKCKGEAGSVGTLLLGVCACP